MGFLAVLAAVGASILLVATVFVVMPLVPVFFLLAALS